MNDIKINLTMFVQGATMMSEQECSKQLKKPVLIKKGKYAGKQAKDKEGNLLWYYEDVPDITKYDRHEVRVSSPTEKGKTELITFFTRKNREAKQTINMTKEAYDYMISTEVPYEYRAPKDFKPTKKKNLSIHAQAWKACSLQQRLEWHLNNICESLGGRMASYTVFND